MVGWLGEASRGPSLRAAPAGTGGGPCVPSSLRVCGGKSRSLGSGSLGEEWSWLHSQRTQCWLGPLIFQVRGPLLKNH